MKKKTHTKEPTIEAIQLKCIESFEFFCRFLTIQAYDLTQSPGPENGLRSQPFILKKHQRELVKFIETPTAPNEKIILKSRQIGITEVLLAYCLWKLLYRLQSKDPLHHFR
jgi:hypothetical protein